MKIFRSIINAARAARARIKTEERHPGKHVRRIIRGKLIGWEWQVWSWGGSLLASGRSHSLPIAQAVSDHWSKVLGFQIDHDVIKERQPWPRFRS